MALCDIDRPLTFAHGTGLGSISLIVNGHNLSARAGSPPEDRSCSTATADSAGSYGS
jgi:hypothetical protein